LFSYGRAVRSDGRGNPQSAAPKQQGSSAMSTGISLHLGLNRVSKEHYGDEKPLRGCHNDAKDMSHISSVEGYTSTVLLDQEATADAVLRRVRDAAGRLVSGDTFVLSYAGHGSQVADRDRDGDDEDDGKDETWLLFDRMLLDDELLVALAEFRPGVRVLVVSDSCHSGTIAGFSRLLAALRQGFAMLFGRATAHPLFRTPSSANFGAWVWQQHPETYKPLKAGLPKDAKSQVRAAVIQLSACQDDQLAADGASNGLFTRQLKKVWNNGSFTGSHHDFLKQIATQMSDVQTPNYLAMGPGAANFEKQRPFTVAFPTDAEDPVS
jgi:metacaspase-1